MINSTFIHIPGFSYKKERNLWNNNIKTWEDLINKLKSNQTVLFKSDEFDSTNSKNKLILRYLNDSISALINHNIDYFKNLLPKREYWRLISNFPNSLVFLDIETTGLSKIYDEITLIGLFDGNEYNFFLKDYNLRKFIHTIRKYSIVVTFNGTLFDIPFLKAKLPKIKLPPIHIDLRFLLARLGFRGGLKNIEEELGIKRQRETQDINGFQATVLWNQYLRGNLYSLEKLIHYNFDDTVNLNKLLKFAHEGLLKETLPFKIFDFTNIFTKEKEIEFKKLNNNEILINDKKYEIPKPKKHRKIRINQLLSNIKLNSPVIVGIDLTGSEKRGSGWAMLKCGKVKTKILHKDNEIFKNTIEVNPNLISIDSPLSIPKGRKSFSDKSPCRKYGIARECERELKRRGISVFWCLLPSMQSLTKRGIKLAKRFRKSGYKVIESFPGAAQDILLIPRKKTSVDELKYGLTEFGLKGNFITDKVKHDELDAITSALVGYFYLSKNYEALGNEDEDYLIIPDVREGNKIYGGK